VVVGALVALIPMWAFYALVRRSHRWWLWFSAGAVPFLILVIVIAPIWIAPLFNDFEPLRDKRLESEMLALASEAGIEGSDVFEVNGSKQSSKVNAYVAGLFNTKRIVLYDTLTDNFNRDEIRFVMGHEMGHYVMHHVWGHLAVAAAFIFCAMWLLDRSIRPVIRRFSRRFGFERLDDPASLPLVLIFVSVLGFLYNPVSNGASRHWEHAADRYGMEVSGVSGTAAARAFDKLSAFNLSDPDPNPLIEFWFYDHPSIKSRIAFVRQAGP
jgi:Zn-dependent protease with chaperone function